MGSYLLNSRLQICNLSEGTHPHAGTATRLMSLIWFHPATIGTSQVQSARLLRLILGAAAWLTG